jgi:group I intron endonuclease
MFNGVTKRPSHKEIAAMLADGMSREAVGKLHGLDRSDLTFEIYRVTNSVNTKVYVGQTRNGVDKREREHKKFSDDMYFTRAIRKHDIDKFTFTHIASARNLEDLNALEKIIIAQENCRKPRGYNLAEGGNSGAAHPSTRKKLSKAAKAWMADPVKKASHAAAVHAAKEKPGWKENHAEVIRATMATPEWKENHAKAVNDPVVRAKHAANYVYKRERMVAAAAVSNKARFARMREISEPKVFELLKQNKSTAEIARALNRAIDGIRAIRRSLKAVLADHVNTGPRTLVIVPQDKDGGRVTP